MLLFNFFLSRISSCNRNIYRNLTNVEQFGADNNTNIDWITQINKYDTEYRWRQAGSDRIQQSTSIHKYK